MNARQKKLLFTVPLAALPVLGLMALSTPGAQADPIIIEPTPVEIPRTSIEIPRTDIDGEAVAPLHPKDYPQGLLFPYSLIDTAFKGNVDLDGNVAYSNLKDNKSLENYVAAAAYADLSAFPVFDVYSTDNETGRKTKISKNHSAELVFWINTYNALMLSSIARVYPIKSIDLVKNFDTERTHRVAGKDYSFKELREKVASFGDPRALFALASGTAGGFLPSPTAIRYVELSSRLDSAVSVFVNDPRNIALNRIQNVVVVNPMLKDMDTPFAKSRRFKWDGIRQILATYTEQRGNRSYFTTNEYRVDFGKSNRGINDSFNSAIINPMQTSS